MSCMWACFLCDWFPNYAWTACIVSPIWLLWDLGVCMFRCNLPPALLAEWPGSFMCHCGNMGVERTPSKSQLTKLTLEKRFKLATFQSGVRCSYQQAIPAPLRKIFALHAYCPRSKKSKEIFALPAYRPWSQKSLEIFALHTYSPGSSAQVFAGDPFWFEISSFKKCFENVSFLSYFNLLWAEWNNRALHPAAYKVYFSKLNTDPLSICSSVRIVGLVFFQLTVNVT